MSTIPESFPKGLSNYDRETQTLDVEFADGSIIRYFDIDPRLAFLSSTNERRNSDFINFLKQNDGKYGRPQIKQEVLREATESLPEPGHNIVVMGQQNGVTRQNSSSSWLPAWSYKAEGGMK